jgi:hypothetical protein
LEDSCPGPNLFQKSVSEGKINRPSEFTLELLPIAGLILRKNSSGWKTSSWHAEILYGILPFGIVRTG